MNATSKTLFALSFAALSAGACSADIGGATAAPDAGISEVEPDAAPPSIECEEPPPQLMIVLDRSGSFSLRPDGTFAPNTDEGKQETRWHIMIEAIRGVTTNLQEDVQFGLTLFPNDPEGADGRDCSNLDTWLEEWLPPETNDLSCQPGEVKVSPNMMNGGAMQSALDRDNTGLCNTTPIGSGLAAAHAELSAIATTEYEQAAVLITDGADNCDVRDGYNTNSLAEADAMAAAGIRVFVLGFSGTGDELNPDHLNNLACAGGTAPDFDINCEQIGDGYRAVEGNQKRLYHLAGEVDSLTESLQEISEEACNEAPVDLRRID
jgi:hypothetical protein